MPRSNVAFVDDDLDDLWTPSPAELGLSPNVIRGVVEDEDDVGFRELYARPELIRPWRWPEAA